MLQGYRWSEKSHGWTLSLMRSLGDMCPAGVTNSMHLLTMWTQEGSGLLWSRHHYEAECAPTRAQCQRDRMVEKKNLRSLVKSGFPKERRKSGFSIKFPFNGGSYISVLVFVFQWCEDQGSEMGPISLQCEISNIKKPKY